MMTKAKRPFQSDQLRTSFRGWRLIVTKRAVTGIKGKKTFELDRFTSFAEAMKAGKLEVDKREGPQAWDPNYTNQALQGK